MVRPYFPRGEYGCLNLKGLTMITPNELIIKTFVSKKEKSYVHHKAEEYGVEIFHIPTTTTITVDFYKNAFKNKQCAIRFLEQLLESNERHIYS